MFGNMLIGDLCFINMIHSVMRNGAYEAFSFQERECTFLCNNPFTIVSCKLASRQIAIACIAQMSVTENMGVFKGRGTGSPERFAHQLKSSAHALRYSSV